MKIESEDVLYYKSILESFVKINNKIKKIEETVKKKELEIEKLNDDLSDLRYSEMDLYKKYSEKYNIDLNEVKKEFLKIIF